MNRGGFMRDGGRDNPNRHANVQKRSGRDYMHIFLRLVRYMLRYWPLVLGALIMTVLSNQLALIGPSYMGAALDAIESESGVQFDAVWESFFYMVVCYVLAEILSYLLTLIMINLSQRITYTMRRQLFEKLTTLPVGYFDTHATGDIISRISYDIDTINSTLSTDMIQILRSVYMVIGSFCFMYTISRPLLLVFVITVPIAIIFTRYKSRRIRPLFRERSRKLGELNGFAEEMLSGAKTVRAYRREGVICGRFDEKNELAVDAHYNADYQGSLIGPTVNFINNLSLSLIMIFGGILLLLSRTSGSVWFAEGAVWFSFFLTFGRLSEFIVYSRKFAGPINEFTNIISEFQSAFAAAERVFRILDEEPEPADREGAISLPAPTGEVVMRDVSFGYTEEREILHGVNLHARAGQTVAIVGPTGSGKTTIINLLMRFYDISSGDILIDGTGISDIKRDDLRLAYTMVLQNTWLFKGTIYENITYGREDATREEVVEAAKAAKIHSFIMSLPDGYDTVLSDDGVNISKGQKQLITIARAMLVRSPMLLLDEATSNVDSRTEIQIQSAMNALMQGRTCFIIAHRLSTVQNADIILVVKDGEIIESGNHGELLAKGGFYATLYNSQFS